jgi:zinc protease
VSAAVSPETPPRRPFRERVARQVGTSGSVYLALENHFNPTVAISGSLRAGSGFSPADRPVLGGLTAEMLDKGTRRRGKMEIAEALESRGASVSFSADAGDPLLLDIAASCLSRDLDLVVDALVEMLTESAFPEEELARERERLIGGLRQQQDSTGWRAVSEASRLLYPRDHPFYQPDSETKIASVHSATREEIARFYEESYGGASLLLACVGDLDAEQTVRNLDRRLAGWRAGRTRPDPAIVPLPARADTRLIPMKDKPNVDVVLARHGGLKRTDPDYIAATLGNSALGQSTLSSRLGLRVRDTEGLTYGIHSRFAAARVAGPFVVSLTVAPANLDRAVASTRQILETFVGGGITEKELVQEKESRVGRFKVDLASNAGLASALESAEAYGFGVGYLDDFPECVEVATKAEVDEAIGRHVRTDDLVLVAAGEL